MRKPYQINREKTPDLEAFYRFLGEDQDQTKRFKEDLEPLTCWTRAKAALKSANLRRVVEVSSDKPYPFTVVNKQDRSVMTLIRDKKDKPIYFPQPGLNKKELVYIDVLETNVSQFAQFLTAKGNLEEGKTPYYDSTAPNPDLVEDPDKKGKWKVVNDDCRGCAVSNVSW